MYTGEEIKNAQEDRRSSILKSFDLDIEKARSGTYSDTPENRKLNRVGKKYGSSSEKDSSSDSKKTSGEPSKKESGAGKTLEEHARNSSDSALEAAAKGSDEKLRIAAKKEIERRANEHKDDKKGDKTNNSQTLKNGDTVTTPDGIGKIKSFRKDAEHFIVKLENGDENPYQERELKLNKTSDKTNGSKKVEMTKDDKKEVDKITAEEKFKRAKKAWMSAVADDDIEAAEIYRAKMKEFHDIFSKKDVSNDTTKELDKLKKLGVTYTLGNSKVSPIESVNVPMNLSDEDYDKINDVIDRYNLSSKRKVKN